MKSELLFIFKCIYNIKISVMLVGTLIKVPFRLNPAFCSICCGYREVKFWNLEFDLLFYFKCVYYIKI